METQDVFFWRLAGRSAPTGLANCPLDRVLTYKNLIYLLNLQICLVRCLFVSRFTNIVLVVYSWKKNQKMSFAKTKILLNIETDQDHRLGTKKKKKKEKKRKIQISSFTFDEAVFKNSFITWKRFALFECTYLCIFTTI